MDPDLYQKLHAEGLISDQSFEKLAQQRQSGLFSVHLELNMVLYLGVTVLSAGLGILVYKNIDTIGHQATLAFIAAISIGCFTYCTKLKRPFNKQQIKSPNLAFDYVLLLAAVSMVTFFGYIQFQYQVFGINNYGMATFIPMLALFFIAYFFDHLGILTMAIISLALWMGISVTPKQLLAHGNFNSESVIYTYLVFGLILTVAGYLTNYYQFKSHFKFSYHYYGLHVSLITLIAAYFFYYNNTFALLWLLALFVAVGWFYFDAYKIKSFQFILTAILYGYAGLCCLLFRLTFAAHTTELAVYLFLLFLIGSAIGLVMLLIYLNKKLKS